jgi:predicted nicotinamide N-methyase
MDFKTDQLSLKIGTLTIDLTVIENLDELFEALVNKGSEHPDVVDERIPYWADLWASAIGLSHYLFDNQLLIKHKNVLEIGCGLGLPAIVAGKLGAASTTVTDYLPEALDFAQLNWEKNLSLNNVEFAVLDWRNIPENFSNRTPQYFEGSGIPTVGKADILLAADVAYEKRAFEPLIQAFHQLIKPEGTILIAEPNRYVSKTFFENLENQGFKVKKTTLDIERRGYMFTVNVFELKVVS